jgi:hypothetical protein
MESVVVHFPGINPSLLAYQFADGRGGQLIRELKLGGVNHDTVRKWVKNCVCAEKQRSFCHKGGRHHIKHASKI